MANASHNPNADFGPELTQAAGVASSVADKTSRLAHDLKDQGTEALGNAKEAVTGALSDAATEAGSRIDAAREKIADGGDRVADRLRNASQESGGDGVQARVLDSLASGLTSVSDFLRSADVAQMAGGVQRFARRNPALFAAGAAVAGLVVARAISGAYSGRDGADDAEARRGTDFAERFYGANGAEDHDRKART